MNIIAVGEPFKYGYQIPTTIWKVTGKGTKIVFIPFRQDLDFRIRIRIFCEDEFAGAVIRASTEDAGSGALQHTSSAGLHCHQAIIDINSHGYSSQVTIFVFSLRESFSYEARTWDGY